MGVSDHAFGKILTQISSEKSPLTNASRHTCHCYYSPCQKMNPDGHMSTRTSHPSGCSDKSEHTTLVKSVRDKTWAPCQLLWEKLSLEAILLSCGSALLPWRMRMRWTPQEGERWEAKEGVLVTPHEPLEQVSVKTRVEFSVTWTIKQSW